MSILTAIDSIYEVSHGLSNDELRNRVQKVERFINQSADQLSALNASLPGVYALVKETARRFSQGDIEVTANERDCLLAGQCDFVRLTTDGKARYANRWLVDFQEYQWNMVHYEEQMLAGIYLHYGYAVEMATGEGKTLVATLPVFLNALTHRGVHVMTVNDYLSRRDFEITRPVYLFHGLSVDCIELSYDTYSPQRRQAYRADITFGVNSSFAFDYLFDHLALSSDKCVQREHYYALVDELDSVFIDDADAPHVVGGGYPYNQGKVYREYNVWMKELLESSSLPQLYQVDKLEKKAWFTPEGQSWLADKTGIPDLYQTCQPLESAEDKDRMAHHRFVRQVLSQLLNAYTLYEKEVDYVVQEGRIIIIDPHTGRLKPRNRWEHGLHTAMEVKEGVSVQPDSDSIATISLKNYFKLYNRYCGMSGTLQAVADELKEVYGLPVKAIPTHRTMIRVDMPIRVFKTLQAKDRSIVEEVAQIHQTGRPVLVGCLTTKRAIRLNNLLQEKGLPSNLLDVNNLDKEALYIAQAGKQGAITVSTPIAGRGTDIKLSAEACRRGGLAIIGADVFDSKRIDQQLKGRAGRQGDPGTSQFFVSAEDLIMRNLPPQEWEVFSRLVVGTETDEIASQIVSFWVWKAQACREAYFARKRRDTACKDDLIAPYREELYRQRNRMLADSRAAYQLADILFSARQEEWDSVNRALWQHYGVILSLLRKEQANNARAKEMVIPFAENAQLYGIELDIAQTLDGFSYFESVFLQQVILGVYDGYWKKFILHVMEDLNEQEICHLPDEFKVMQEEGNQTIRNRLRYSVIPVSKLSIPEEIQKFSQKEESCIRPTAHLGTNDLCPCGSGKKFGECHGQGIRQTKYRRRF